MFEPGYLSHEIEFRRPDVAVRATEHLRLPASLLEPEVVRNDVLAQDVVGVQAEVARCGTEHHRLLPRWELAQLRHPELDHEPATGQEMARGIAEARDLFGLDEQVGDSSRGI